MQTGLDQAAFDACVARQDDAALLERAKAEAERYAIRSTPTLFVNGRPIPYAPPQEFLKMIVDEELLLQARRAAAR